MTIVLDAIIVLMVLCGFGIYHYSKEKGDLREYEIKFMKEHETNSDQLIKLNFSPDDEKLFINLCSYHIKLKKLLRRAPGIQEHFLLLKHIEHHPFPMQMVRCTSRFAIIDAGPKDFQCAYLLKKGKRPKHFRGKVFNIYAKFCYFKESEEEAETDEELLDSQELSGERYDYEPPLVPNYPQAPNVDHRYNVDPGPVDFHERQPLYVQNAQFGYPPQDLTQQMNYRGIDPTTGGQYYPKENFNVPEMNPDRGVTDVETRLPHRYEDAPTYVSDTDREQSDYSLPEEHAYRKRPRGRRMMNEKDLFAEYETDDEEEEEPIEHNTRPPRSLERNKSIRQRLRENS